MAVYLLAAHVVHYHLLQQQESLIVVK